MRRIRELKAKLQALEKLCDEPFRTLNTKEQTELDQLTILLEDNFKYLFDYTAMVHYHSIDFQVPQ